MLQCGLSLTQQKCREGDGSYPPPSLYDVSGSAHWDNMADVGMVVHRDFEADQTRVIIRKIGNKVCMAQSVRRFSNIACRVMYTSQR